MLSVESFITLHSREHTTIVLLKGHVIHFLLRAYAYTHRPSMPLGRDPEKPLLQ